MTDNLIIGPGYVGGLLAKKLLERGERVWAVKRSTGPVPPGVTPIYGNIADPGTCAKIPGTIEAIFYTAAPGSGDEASYREVYVDGLKALLARLGENPTQARRLIVTSSTGVYHQTDGSWVDEESPTNPSRGTARRILEGEALLETAQIETISLRLAGIYGPGRTRLIQSVASGDAVCVQGQTHYTNRIHREDCAEALIFLMQVPNPHNLFIGVDHDPAERLDVLSWIAEKIHAPEPRCVEAEAANPRLRHGNKRCKNTRLTDAGFTFKFPSYRDGYAPMVKEWAPTPQ